MAPPPIAAAAVGVSGGAAVGRRKDRLAIRTGIAVPVDPRSLPSPLSGFRAAVKDGADVAFEVTGTRTGDRLRLARWMPTTAAQYAVLMAVLARSLGIPARVAVGYQIPAGAGGTVSVTGSEALDVAVDAGFRPGKAQVQWDTAIDRIRELLAGLRTGARVRARLSVASLRQRTRVWDAVRSGWPCGRIHLQGSDSWPQIPGVGRSFTASRR